MVSWSEIQLRISKEVPESLLDAGVDFKVIDFSLFGSAKSAIVSPRGSGMTPLGVLKIKLIDWDTTVTVADCRFGDQLGGFGQRLTGVVSLSNERGFDHTTVAIGNGQTQHGEHLTCGFLKYGGGLLVLFRELVQ